MKTPIYLDNHATTPLDPRVLEAMMPYFKEKFGNASSASHSFGQTAAKAVDQAREQVAAIIGAKPSEILFTSGGTESDNLGLQGIARAYRDRGNHIITAASEHKAVLLSCEQLAKEGFEITVLPVDQTGSVDPESIRSAITAKTILISIMAVNNELGTITNLQAIGKIAKEKGILFHTDAVQAVGKIPVDVNQWNVDALSLSAHKIYGPKGVGAFYLREKSPRIRFSPLFFGGGQEKGLRSGTYNVPGIVGLGEACSICQKELPAESARLSKLRKKLFEGITSRVDNVSLNGPTIENRLPGNLNLAFHFVDGEALMNGLNDLGLSSGSACTSAEVKPSHVLTAIGLSKELAKSSLRFGLGRFNTEEEIDYAVERVISEIARLRAISPLHGKNPK